MNDIYDVSAAPPATTRKPDVADHVTVYTPDSALRDPGRLIGEMLRDLWAGRELAWRLAVRDISAQYRQTALGLVWAFILPWPTPRSGCS